MKATAPVRASKEDRALGVMRVANHLDDFAGLLKLVRRNRRKYRGASCSLAIGSGIFASVRGVDSLGSDSFCVWNCM